MGVLPGLKNTTNYSHSSIRIADALMSDPSTSRISSRKQPRQTRSNQLVATILEAAAQVLAAEGATRFTTARVAERAGVSIGSLYQYFPNKASILFRLQSDEWRQTNDMLRHILEDTTTAPPLRLRALVHAFVRSECEEAAMRIALNDAAPFYRDAPEADAARAAGDRIVEAFMRDILPDASQATRDRAGDLILTTMSEVGRRFSETPRTAADIDTQADAMADMFVAYIASLQA